MIRSCLAFFVATTFVAAAAIASPPAQPNVAPEGFTALFNGADLTGWLQDRKPPTNWTVEEGVLAFNGKGASLFHEENFSNFVLLVDWKIPKNGNSGIFLRGGATQAEINDGNPSKPTWNGTSGGLYPDKAPTKHAMKPAGEWNHYEIRVENGVITVFLNGEKTIDAFKKEWGKANKGPIGFQSHGTPVYYKNIFIKKLPD
jgi:hypothetical protein